MIKYLELLGNCCHIRGIKDFRMCCFWKNNQLQGENSNTTSFFFFITLHILKCLISYLSKLSLQHLNWTQTSGRKWQNLLYRHSACFTREAVWVNPLDVGCGDFWQNWWKQKSWGKKITWIGFSPKFQRWCFNIWIHANMLKPLTQSNMVTRGLTVQPYRDVDRRNQHSMNFASKTIAQFEHKKVQSVHPSVLKYTDDRLV